MTTFFALTEAESGLQMRVASGQALTGIEEQVLRHSTFAFPAD